MCPFMKTLTQATQSYLYGRLFLRIFIFSLKGLEEKPLKQCTVQWGPWWQITPLIKAPD